MEKKIGKDEYENHNNILDMFKTKLQDTDNIPTDIELFEHYRITIDESQLNTSIPSMPSISL